MATAGDAKAVASPVTSPAGGTSAVGFSLLMFIVIGALFIVILLHGWHWAPVTVGREPG
jgi:hypothetical protein